MFTYVAITYAICLTSQFVNGYSILGFVPNGKPMKIV